MSIFREEILDHYKHPRNFGELPDATARAEEENMPCGDHIAIGIKVSDDQITDVKFSGSGCALSTAVTSMLTEDIKKETLAQVETLKENDILQYVGGSVTSGRVNCVLLGWKTLKKAITQVGARRVAPVQVTRDMNLGEVAARWPQARAKLLDYGLHCVGCFASSFDTIEAGAKVHGMSEGEIEEMIGEINHAIISHGSKSG